MADVKRAAYFCYLLAAEQDRVVTGSIAVRMRRASFLCAKIKRSPSEPAPSSMGATRALRARLLHIASVSARMLRELLPLCHKHAVVALQAVHALALPLRLSFQASNADEYPRHDASTHVGQHVMSSPNTARTSYLITGSP